MKQLSVSHEQFVGDQLLGPKGALLVDLLLVESSPPRCFALLVGSRLVDVPLRDTHGRDTKVTNSRDGCKTQKVQKTNAPRRIAHLFDVMSSIIVNQR
jgi:hypothetical protein